MSVSSAESFATADYRMLDVTFQAFSWGRIPVSLILQRNRLIA